MIHTVTLNPSIDYVINLSDLRRNCVNIVNSNNVYIGGKGINVSRILNEHGVHNRALGFISGFTGSFIENVLGGEFITTDFINVNNNFSRINIKMKIQDEETEINGLGPKISQENIDELYDKLNSIKDGDVLVLAGSIPKDLGEDFYEKIMDNLKSKEVKIIVDARGNLLLNVLKYKPFLIKPNQHEISEIFDLKDQSIETLINYGFKLKEMGAMNILISLGKDGAILISENGEIYKSNVPKGTLKNSVGSGDSMVGGFMASYIKNGSYEESLKMGAASGSATAFSSDLANINLIKTLLNEINITKL